MPLAAVAGKARVTVWLLPAATLNGDAGEVVVPAGKPVSVSCAEPLKPFWPVIETLKVVLDVPGLAVIALGDSTILKSGVASIFNVSAVECDKDPELALAVTV